MRLLQKHIERGRQIMEGTLKKLFGQYGFFETNEGKQVYVRRDDLPPNAQEGLRATFTPVDRGGASPQATNVKVITEDRPPRRDDQRGRDRPDRQQQQREPQYKIAVTLESRDVVIHESEKSLEIPIVLSAKRGNAPAPGLTVEYHLNSQQMDEDCTTDGSGHSYFNALTTADATFANVVAVVKDGNHPVGVFRYTWRKPAAKDESCKTLKAKPLGVGLDGWHTFEVLAQMDGGAPCGDKKARVIGPEIEVKHNGTEVTESFELSGGHAVVQVRMKNQNHSGEIFFCLDDNPAIRSDTFTLDKWQEKKDKPKVCGHIAAQIIGSDGTWTTVRYIALASDQRDAEAIPNTELLLESGREMEVKDVRTGTSVEIKADVNGVAVEQIKFTKPGKGEVAGRLKANPRVESAKVEIETIAPPKDNDGWSVEFLNPPRDPDPATGLFALTVLVKRHGKEANGPISISSSPEDVDVFQKNAFGMLTRATTDFTSIAPGRYQLHISSQGLMVKVTVKVGDAEASTHLRK